MATCTGICVVVLACCLAPSLAQAAEGVRGTVRDSSGAAIAGAEVLILTAQRSVLTTTTTGADGAFHVPRVGPGSYLVVARSRSFGEEQVAVTVNPGSEAAVTVRLEPAAIREVVTVTASPGEALEDRQAIQPVNVVSARELDQRVVTVVAQAVAAEPGVQVQRTSPSIAGVFVRGLTGNKVNVFVDGVRYSTGAQRGGINTFLTLIEPGALDRIEVLRGPNSAEYGSDALGGSVQMLGRVPALSPDGRTRYGGRYALRAGTAHHVAGSNASLSVSRPAFGLFADAGAQWTGRLRPGGGRDSHAAVTRFFGVASDVVLPGRLPDTGFRQAGGMLKANWTPNARTQIVSTYVATRQDGGARYDQMLGGDGNLVAALNDLRLDLFYVRAERILDRWFDVASVTVSVNSQREERVNQGGNGDPTATIGHEPERTTANGIRASVIRHLSPRHTVHAGGELYVEGLASDAFNVSPGTGAITPRRPRVPDGATFRHGGAFAQSGFEAIPGRLKVIGALRWAGARYEAQASDAPLVAGVPLWPDDELAAGAVTFRAGAVATLGEAWSVSTSASRGYRVPHMTDLGTLGLTGSGFEVAFADVAGLGGMVGSSAVPGAVSTGQPVEQLRPETSLSWDGTVRYRTGRARAELSLFVNTVRDNIQKQALIMPPGAVGTLIGGEPITAQDANGVVFVDLSTAPVLVRDNFDRARIWGVETSAQAPIGPTLVASGTFTVVRARDLDSGLPPNIEGGTPAPGGSLMLLVQPPGRRWWIQPYLAFAADQPRLSSLDLGDRRTGAARSRTSIARFFRNGATARGWIAPGADQRLGTADDTLRATGETLAQIQDRVLGEAVSAPLYTAVKGYAAVGVRAGLRFERHELLIDGENLTDTNYRGISWGVDAPGVGVNVRYVVRF